MQEYSTQNLKFAYLLTSIIEPTYSYRLKSPKSQSIGKIRSQGEICLFARQTENKTNMTGTKIKKDEYDNKGFYF